MMNVKEIIFSHVFFFRENPKYKDIFITIFAFLLSFGFFEGRN